MNRLGSRLASIAVASLLAVTAGCASMRMRVDPERLKRVETLAPITFLANRSVSPPGAAGDSSFLPAEPTDATAEMIFESGIPAFFQALRGTQRFKVALPEQVLAARSYAAFPAALAGMNANGAQLARGGWRYTTPDDGAKIANLLEEIDADAALITYWRFSLDSATRGDIGVAMATPRAHLRAWLIGRDGKIAADDEIEVASDESIAVINGRYDAQALAGLFDDSITTCAVRLVADLSNARAKARGE